MKKMFLHALIAVSFKILTPDVSIADDVQSIPSVITFNTGMVISNFAESEDNLVTTDGSAGNTVPAYSGSASLIPIDIMYENFTSLNTSWFVRAMGPLISSTENNYFSVGGGLNYYIGPIGSKAVFKGKKMQLKIEPKLAYYFGGDLGVGYLIYNTISEKKGDALLEIGGHGGIIYPINEKWGMRGEVGLTRSIGTLVSATQIKALVGLTLNLGVK
jgi:hypothetical protein